VTAVVLNGAGGANTDPSVWCIDAAGMGSTTNYVPVWERGFRGLSVYNTHDYDLPQRCIEAWWELPDTWVMHNIEGDPYAGLGGAAVGAQYARAGIARMRDRGHLGETAAVFSFVDFGPTSAQFPILDETHRSAVETAQILGQELIGFYLPPVYGRHVAVQPWFPANGVLWQWGGGGAPEWWTTVKQAGPSSTPALAHDMSGFGFAADENRLYGPMAGWTGYGAPQPTGDPVRHFVNNGEPFPAFVNDWGEAQNGPDPGGQWPAGWLIFEMVTSGKTHVSGAEWNALVPGGGAGIDPKVGFVEQWTTGRIQSMPNARHATASTAPAAARLSGVQIDTVPGRAAAVYDA
jgi:hypothetical protein